MKLLLDACIWHGARDELRAAGHDVVWAGDWFPDPGDAVILQRAHQEGRILITRDKDFGELVFLRGLSHAGILRLVRFPVRQQGSIALLVLDLYGDDLAQGAIVTADPRRVRVRPP